MSSRNALIIDDEEDLCLLMQMTLKKMHIQSSIAYNLTDAKKILSQQTFDFCLTDLNLPDGSGLSLVEYINENFPNIPVAVITAHGSMDIAIEALKLGAFDFVNKPLELPRLRQIIENALKVEPIENNKVAENDPSIQKLLGNSEVIKELRQTIKKLARSQAPVFIQGESGTGKEVVASLIHELSPRNSGNFIPVNCGAIPSELMESEFFGHKKGSFTGAMSDKKGLFQMADQGTLFLDEVADLPLNMQVKLLRAIQEKKIRPIGAQQEIAVDIRLLSATHKNLADLVTQGKFRQDLYYRINVIELNLPSLNERGSDILLLADFFIRKITADWDSDVLPTLSLAVQDALLKHRYHGNVRELNNILERAITLCDGDEILTTHLQLNQSATQAHVDQANFDDDTDLTFPELTEIVSDPINVTQPVIKKLINQKSVNSTFNNSSIYKIDSYQINTLIDSHTTDNIRTDLVNQKLKELENQQNTQSLLYDSQLKNSNNTETEALVNHHTVTVHTLPDGGIETYLEAEEKRLMLEALQLCNGNKTKASELLGMSFRSFRYKIKKYID